MQNIDKVYYINCAHRTDRKQRIEQMLTNYGFVYECIDAVCIPDHGALGCNLSHIKALQKAKQDKCKHALILEDDFEFIVNKFDLNMLLNYFFTSDYYKLYDVMMLSYNMISSFDIGNQYVGKVLCAQTASGYLVNGSYIDNLCNHISKNTSVFTHTGSHWLYANDQCWKTLQLTDKWYYFKHRVGKQRPGYSDLAQKFVDYNL